MKIEDDTAFFHLLTYLKINEKANDHTSHVLEKPPPYPLFVQPPSISLTARANLEVNLDLNRAITAVNKTNAALQAIVTADRLRWNEIAMFSIFAVVRLIACAGKTAMFNIFAVVRLIACAGKTAIIGTLIRKFLVLGAYIAKEFVGDFKTVWPGLNERFCL